MPRGLESRYLKKFYKKNKLVDKVITFIKHCITATKIVLVAFKLKVLCSFLYYYYYYCDLNSKI